MTVDEFKELLPWVVALLALGKMFVSSGRWAGRIETMADGRPIKNGETNGNGVRAIIEKEVREAVHHCDEKLAGAARERDKLERRIDTDHEKHKKAEAELRSDLTKLADHYRTESAKELERLEARLSGEMAKEIRALHSRLRRTEVRCDALHGLTARGAPLPDDS